MNLRYKAFSQLLAFSILCNISGLRCTLYHGKMQQKKGDQEVRRLLFHTTACSLRRHMKCYLKKHLSIRLQHCCFVRSRVLNASGYHVALAGLDVFLVTRPCLASSVKCECLPLGCGRKSAYGTMPGSYNLSLSSGISHEQQAKVSQVIGHGNENLSVSTTLSMFYLERFT